MKKLIVILGVLIVFLFLPHDKSYADMPVIATPSAITTFYGSGGLGLSGGSYPQWVGVKLTTTNQGLQLCVVNWNFTKIGNPTDNLILKLYKGGSGTNGTLITTSNALSSYGIASGSTPTMLSFQFGSSGYLGLNCQPLEANSDYWIVASRTGSASTDYYSIIYGNISTTPYNTPMFTQFGSVAQYSFLSGSILGYGGVLVSSSSGSIALDLQIPRLQCGAFQDLCDGLTDSINWLIGLVIPQKIDTSGITGLQNTLNQRIPFAYANAIFNLNYTNPASSTALPTFNIPINSTVTLPNTQPVNFNVTVPAQAQQIFTYLRGFTSLFIWISFIVFLALKAKEFID